MLSRKGGQYWHKNEYKKSGKKYISKVRADVLNLHNDIINISKMSICKFMLDPDYVLSMDCVRSYVIKVSPGCTVVLHFPFIFLAKKSVVKRCKPDRIFFSRHKMKWTWRIPLLGSGDGNWVCPEAAAKRRIAFAHFLQLWFKKQLFSISTHKYVSTKVAKN
jgi:hypothetical protein